MEENESEQGDVVPPERTAGYPDQQRSVVFTPTLKWGWSFRTISDALGSYILGVYAGLIGIHAKGWERQPTLQPVLLPTSLHTRQRYFGVRGW